MSLWPFGELFWKCFCRSSFPLSSSFALFFYDLMTNYNVVFRFLELCVYIYYIFAVTRKFLFLIKGYAAAKLLQSCLTLCDPTRLPRPWDSPDKNTGVGCHFLLQCIKVKSESEVTQACPTLSYPTDCSLPCSSVHGIFQARVLEWVDTAFSNERLYVYVIILSC